MTHKDLAVLHLIVSRTRTISRYSERTRESLGLKMNIPSGNTSRAKGLIGHGQMRELSSELLRNAHGSSSKNATATRSRKQWQSPGPES